MNDSFKQLFKGIIAFLLAVVLLLVLSIAFHSCRSQKESTATAKESVEVAQAASSTTETAARSQWSRSLSIDLDSFEMIMPLPYVDTAISHPELGPYSPEAKPHAAGSARYAVLRGKRATIGKSDLAERNASRCARQIDSVASHRTMDMSDHYARDTVGIHKEIPFEEIVDWAMGNSLRSVPVAQSPLKKHPVSQRGALGKIV